MAPIEAIVFDFDGVIVDSEPLYEKAEKELFASYGVDIKTEDLKDTKGLSEKAYLSIIRDRYKMTAPLEEMKLRGRAILKKYFAAELNYIPGFLEFFNIISTQVKTGLATSSTRNLMNWIFDNTQVRNHFRWSVTADDVLHTKPHPEPYRKICHLMDVKPENTMVIEDSANGLKSAIAAGAITIGFLSGSSQDDFPDTDYRASDYQQVEALIVAIIEQKKDK
ncbi:HAD family phosphatase [bacterium]|nr:HAD family phosphatase [bacterium]MBU1065314.1 HAD family phosphatase [bacterium]MBU1633762.1 HAD family phosphatase [bacterium]MBU1873030.1 HAD family phosphatase [bacterium]